MADSPAWEVFGRGAPGLVWASDKAVPTECVPVTRRKSGLSPGQGDRQTKFTGSEQSFFRGRPHHHGTVLVTRCDDLSNKLIDQPVDRPPSPSVLEQLPS